MKSVHSFLITILVIFTAQNHPLAQSSTDLDGNSYLIKVTREKGRALGSNWPDDTLKFESGEMYSIYMSEREGFPSSSYAPKLYNTETAQMILFKYRDYNHGGSLLQIKGKVYGSTIEGTIIWKSLAGTCEYIFLGTML